MPAKQTGRLGQRDSSRLPLRPETVLAFGSGTILAAPPGGGRSAAHECVLRLIAVRSIDMT
jgi:hypothetical protein